MKKNEHFSVTSALLCLLWDLRFMCVFPKVKTSLNVFNSGAKVCHKHKKNIFYHMKKLSTVSKHCIHFLLAGFSID